MILTAALSALLQDGNGDPAPLRSASFEPVNGFSYAEFGVCQLLIACSVSSLKAGQLYKRLFCVILDSCSVHR